MSYISRVVLQIDIDKSSSFVRFLDKEIKSYEGVIDGVTPSGCYISSSNVIFDWDRLDLSSEFAEGVLKKVDELIGKGVRIMVRTYDENVIQKGQEFYIGLYVPHVSRLDYSKFKTVYVAMTGKEL